MLIYCHNVFKFSLSLAVIAVLMIVCQSCVLPSDTSIPKGTIMQREIHVTKQFGVRNFREINLAMSRLTGVPTTDTSVFNVYQSLKSIFPVSNKSTGFQGTVQVAVFRLGSAYCARLFSDAENPDGLVAKMLPDLPVQPDKEKKELKGKKIRETVEYFIDTFWVSNSYRDEALIDKTIADITAFVDSELDETVYSESDETEEREEEDDLKILYTNMCITLVSSAPVVFY